MEHIFDQRTNECYKPKPATFARTERMLSSTGIPQEAYRRWNGDTPFGPGDRLPAPELGRKRYCTIRNLNVVNSLKVGPGCGARYLSRRPFDLCMHCPVPVG